MANGINAHAYTYGRDIVFGENQFTPEIDAGKKLLAHELTHFLQPEQKIIRRSPDKNRVQSPWDDLPSDAQQTLIRSYAILTPYERKLKENWIWNQGGMTAKENYNKLRVNAPLHQQAFLRVYYRMKNVGLWKHVNFITNISGPEPKKCLSRTPQIAFIPHDLMKLIVMLSSEKFCKDTQAASIATKISGIFTGTTQEFKSLGWREVVPAGSAGLHIYPGRLTKVHIDDKSPVRGRSNEGTCIYSMLRSLTHASYDLWRSRVTLFPGMESPSVTEPEPARRRDIIPIAKWRFKLLDWE